MRHQCDNHCPIHIQWNLRITARVDLLLIKDTLGAGLLFLLEKLSPYRRLLASHTPQLELSKAHTPRGESASIGDLQQYMYAQKLDTILNNFHLRLWSLTTFGGYLVWLFVLWGHVFCPLSRDRRVSVCQRLKMCYFYGKDNQGTWFVHCIEAVCISESPLWRFHCIYIVVKVSANDIEPLEI